MKKVLAYCFSKGDPILVLLLIVNFILCLYFIFFRSDPLYVPFNEYIDIAANLAAGKGYIGSGFFHLRIGPTAFLNPLYTGLVALFVIFFKLPYAYLGVRILQAFANTLICLNIYLISREIFNKKAALLSCFIFSVYLTFIFWTIFIWDTILFSLAISFLMLSILKFNNHNYSQSILIGLIIGVALLLNPVILIFLPFMLAYFFVKFRETFNRTFINMALILCISMILILPWSIRNYMVFKAFIPFRTGFWLNLYLGNNEDATGTVFLKHNGLVPEDFNEGITYHFRPMIGALIRMNELEQDQFFKKRLFDYARKHPSGLFKLMPKKIYYYLWFNPYENKSFVGLAEYSFILITALYGLYHSIRGKKRILLLLLVIFSFVLAYALIGPFFNWKYRLPIEPYFIVLSGYGIFKLLPKKLKKNA